MLKGGIHASVLSFLHQTGKEEIANGNIFGKQMHEMATLSELSIRAYDFFFFFFFAFITELVSEYNGERTVHECGSEFIDELRFCLGSKV